MTDEIMSLYKLWCEKATDDADLQTELKNIEGDNDAILDRFYRDLEFGTGGLRGVIGAKFHAGQRVHDGGAELPLL